MDVDDVVAGLWLSASNEDAVRHWTDSLLRNGSLAHLRRVDAAPNLPFSPTCRSIHSHV